MIIITLFSIDFLYNVKPVNFKCLLGVNHVSIFVQVMCHNDTKSMTPPPTCYSRHFQIFGKIDSFPKNKKQKNECRKGKKSKMHI